MVHHGYHEDIVLVANHDASWFVNVAPDQAVANAVQIAFPPLLTHDIPWWAPPALNGSIPTSAYKTAPVAATADRAITAITAGVQIKLRSQDKQKLHLIASYCFQMHRFSQFSHSSFYLLCFQPSVRCSGCGMAKQWYILMIFLSGRRLPGRPLYKVILLIVMFY